MRILLVSDLPPWVSGGLERHVGDLAAELRDRGTPALVVAGSTKAEMRPGVIATPTALSWVPGAFRSRERPFHPPWPDPRFARTLVEVGRRWRATVIHAHGWSAASAAVAARHLHVPLLVTLHDYGFACPTKTMCTQGPRLCPGPTSAAHGQCAARLMGRPKSEALSFALPLLRQLLKRATLIAVSESVRRAAYHALGQEVRVIPNFVRADVFSNVPEPTYAGPRVLFLGGNNPVKGLSVIEQAVSHSSAELTVAGPPPEYRTLGVDYIGLVERHRIGPLMDQSNMVVVPSIWEEPCPTAVLEAMARSRLVIASKVGGVSEILQGTAGLLVPPNDSAALRLAIQDLGKSTERRRRLATAGQSRASSHYSASAVVPQIIHAYEAAR